MSQLDFEEAGEEGSEQRESFEHEIVQDMSNATEVPPDRFVVKNLSPGSIIVEIDIKPDQSGKGPNSLAVVSELKRQAADPDSTLLHGLITRHTESVMIVPQVQIPSRPCLRIAFSCMCNVILLRSPDTLVGCSHPRIPFWGS